MANGAGGVLTKDSDGRGDLERAGVDVEKVDTCAGLRLARGIDKRSSDDLIMKSKLRVHVRTWN